MNHKPALVQLLSLCLTGLACAIATLSIPERMNAQTAKLTDSQIDRYASAVYEIDKKREDVLRRAKNDRSWSEVADLAEKSSTEVCRLDPSLRSPAINKLCDELFEFSEAKIREHGFANNREFNQITITQQQDLVLQGKIQARLMQLRGYR